MADAFQLHKATLEDVARSLGELYGRVTVSKDPLFGWVQIVNDVTILAEDVRRRRHDEGGRRAVKILFRLLEFIGYYSYEIKPQDNSGTFARFFAWQLQRSSFAELVDGGTAGGPSAWILLKYPRVCSKCGRCPCHCLVTPWVFEERRENPGPYERFRSAVENRRRALTRDGNCLPQLTIPDLLRLFKGIYGNAYNVSDPWKIGMHLSEELGEATIELSRLQLAWRGKRLQLGEWLAEAGSIAQKKIEREREGMERRGASKDMCEARATLLTNRLEKYLKELSDDEPWEAFCRFVSDKFKEETADVFSWLSALLVKLADEVAIPTKKGVFRKDDVSQALTMVKEVYGEFVAGAGSGNDSLKCRWCGKPRCTNGCLITHSVSSELVERIGKM